MPLTIGSRIAFTYPTDTGIQQLHANFDAKADGFYVAALGKIYAYSTAGAREASRDITLENLPSTETVWGFTSLADGGWGVMTREVLGGASNVIGAVRLFEANGQARRVFNVDAVFQGFLTERFRAPKALVEHNTDLYVRVVRDPIGDGHMRFLQYRADGTAVHENHLLNATEPSRLSDATAEGGNIFVVQQTAQILYGAPFSSFELNTDLQTTLDSRNDSPWAAASHGSTVYVADRGGFIYAYEDVPDAPPPSTGENFGGFGLSIISIFLLNERLGRDFARNDYASS